ncbi:MAG: excinuclease ABC subunit UvrC [Deltaproteobacteria bacterium]|nr:excinuclease ABC subunit UvrC [Deltaproteobacteria bacterium]
MRDKLRDKIAALPEEPGVYVMKGEDGRVLYVGKAKNLQKRVRSYFEGGRDERVQIPFLESMLADIEAMVVGTEKEALILENELIKQHKPPFNIKLREGGNFVYLKLDPGKDYPRLEVTRQVAPDGARYFGPYPAARALRETLRVINRHFQLRTCADHDPRSHQRPCLLCQISRFPAPSVFDIPKEEYRRHVEDAIAFLEGRKPELLESLKRRMQEASDAMKFEEAARLRDRIQAVERTLERQKVTLGGNYNWDVLGLHREGNDLAVYLLFVRGGRVAGGRAFIFPGQGFPEREVLASFLNLYYSQGHLLPDKVLLPLEIEGMRSLADFLRERKASKAQFVVPRGGIAYELVKMAARNASQALEQSRPREEKDPEVLAALAEKLHLQKAPHRMECFDVSHFQGDAIVASKAAMTKGRLDKARYRRYRLRTVIVGDDYRAMYEVLSRRLRRGLETNDLPDLIVLDGGKVQLSAGLQALEDLGVTGVEIVALAKKREIGTAGLLEPAQAPERLYLPGMDQPVVLPPDSPELLTLVLLRDEAHRFAISYQKKLGRKERLRSELDLIPGIGQARKTELLRRFGSLEQLRRASLTELEKVEGLGPKLAKRVYEFFRKKKSLTKALRR